MTVLIQTLGAIRRGDWRVDWLPLAILAIFGAILALDPARIGAALSIATGALASSSVYILLAAGLLGFLKAAGAETLVAQAFTGPRWRMIVLAALFGGLAPFCSCEVIPFVAGLLALGAPLSAVMAFWLSSPLIDPPTALITAAALGWEFALGKAVAAVAIGLAGGLAMEALAGMGAFADPLKPGVGGRRGCGCGPSPFNGRPVWAFWRAPERRAVFLREAGGNALFLLRWLALAYTLEAALILYLPAEVVASVIGGDGLSAIVIAALAGAPAYLNGYAAPPLVAGLMAQGMGPGAAMAFLTAGAVSSLPAMAAVWSLVRGPVFLAYLGLGLLGAIGAGATFQAILG